jgi:hypothetical protein
MTTPDFSAKCGKPVLARPVAKQLFSASNASKLKTICLSGQNTYTENCVE